ncbi:MAG: hypothetical protein EOP09_20600 [Proteobacteria bacterium]|nr:MAG: hypothetical protein EOP09_20600 [Pseudomonadota bacterium]
MKNLDQYSAEDTAQRLRKLLAAAFDMKPIPLKDIPKGNGESRAGARKKTRASAATSKSARPKP